MDANQHVTPELVQALMDRINLLETQMAATPYSNDDPNVTFRGPGAEFTPPPHILERLPHLEDNFFKRPLDENQRKRFLSECPKNTLRNYDPPKLNHIKVAPQVKHWDSQLSNIQCRLSGITSPLDWFQYQLHNEQWDLSTLQEQANDLVTTVHHLLADLATHLSSVRTDNVYKGLPGQLDAPSADSDNVLLDPKELVDYVKLQQTVYSATQSSQKRRKHKQRSQQSSNHDTPAHSNQGNSYNSGSSNSSDNHFQNSQNKGFQQRHNQKKPL